MDKLSLIIPVAHYPFFVKSILENISETCGLSFNDFDMVFLIGQNASPRLLQALQKYQKQFSFRVVVVPINCWSNHLELIDWTLENDKRIGDWICLQHCDMVWRQESCGWLVKCAELTDKESIAITCPWRGGYRYLYNGQKTLPMHDFFGLYNKHLLLKNNLKFTWGIIDKDIHLSPTVRKEIIAGNLTRCMKTYWQRTKGPTMSPGIDGMDGSEAIGVEIAVRFPHLVKLINLEKHIAHLWGFYRVGDLVNKNNGVDISSEMQNMYILKALMRYSWMTCFLFDQKDYENKVMPWAFFEQFFENHPATNICKEWVRYADLEANILGHRVPCWLKYIKYGSNYFTYDKQFNQSKLL